jgi:hypothetical protein
LLPNVPACSDHGAGIRVSRSSKDRKSSSSADHEKQYVSFLVFDHTFPSSRDDDAAGGIDGVTSDAIRTVREGPASDQETRQGTQLV